MGVVLREVLRSGLRLLGCLSGDGHGILRNLITFNACGSVHFQCTLRFPSSARPGVRREERDKEYMCVRRAAYRMYFDRSLSPAILPIFSRT